MIQSVSPRSLRPRAGARVASFAGGARLRAVVRGFDPPKCQVPLSASLTLRAQYLVHVVRIVHRSSRNSYTLPRHEYIVEEIYT